MAKQWRIELLGGLQARRGDQLVTHFRTHKTGLLLAYLVILAVPQLRAFFELAPLSLPEYLLLGAIAVGWALLLRLTWRARVLDRFLSVETT